MVVACESVDQIFFSLAYGSCRVLPILCHVLKVLLMWKVNFKEKSSTSHKEISFSCAIQECDNVTTPLLSIFCPTVPQIFAYERLNTIENVKLLKVVTAAYERWSLPRSSKYSDLTWKLLVFCKTGRWGEVLASQRWSQPEVRLYLQYYADETTISR